jgi:leucyl aminopeptidase
MSKLKSYEILNAKLPDIKIKKENFTQYKSDLVLPVFKTDFSKDGELNADDLRPLDEANKGIISRTVKLNKFTGEEESLLTVLLDDYELMLVGCGNEPTYKKDEFISEKIPGYIKYKLLGIKASELAVKYSKESIAIGLRKVGNDASIDLVLRNLSDGVIRGLYKFDYKNTDDKSNTKNEVINLNEVFVLLTQKMNDDKSEEAVKSGLIIGKSVNIARSLVDETPNNLYPQTYVDFIKEYFKDSPCDIEVWDKNKIKKEGMGCLSAVSRGNDDDKTQAKFVIIRSKRKSSNGKVALVGKGITFDTGGYNLKRRPQSIALMKKDMGGSGAIFSTTKAILDINLDIELVTAVPLTENSISRSAIKPGDIIKAYNGKTVEIINTDAEGRLAIADALSYVAENEKPDYIIDAATLTSAGMISLGVKIGGFLGLDSECIELFGKSALEHGEMFWNLPLPSIYKDDIKGDISDLRNIPKNFSKYAGTLLAGLFLSEFVGDCRKWIHIDMSGPTYAVSKTYLGKTALGFSVASIIRYVENIINTNC